MTPILEIGICSFLAVLFAQSSFHKVRNFPQFCGVVGSYTAGVLSPNSLSVRLLASVVVVCEMAVVLAAASGLSSILVGSLAISLLVLYALAMALNLGRAHSIIDCGCSWVPGRPLSWWLPVRNFCVAIYAALLLLPQRVQSLDSFEMANGVALALATYIVYMGIDQYLENRVAEGV